MKNSLRPLILGATACLIAAGCDSDGSDNVAADAGRVLDANVDGARADATDGSALTSDAKLSDSATPPDARIETPCTSSPGADSDKDGFINGVDCNDCDPLINPGAYDIARNGVDDDCSGAADDEPALCDEGLALAGDEALDGAKALGLCRAQRGSSWGTVSAKWVYPDGSSRSLDGYICPANQPPHPLSRGILPKFGTNNATLEGKSMVALASGVARSGKMVLGQEQRPASGFSPIAANMCRPVRPPSGFPKASTVCPGSTSGADVVYDGVALELAIRVPTNAVAFGFDFNFFTAEFPKYVCDGKNDQFVALLTSKHAGVPADKNISFDKMGNAIAVDTAFLDVCSPVSYNGHTFACTRGPRGLEGTDLHVQSSGVDGAMFMMGGATGWLTSTAPVVPGETITVRFAIWDSDDPINDSTVLLDHVHWVFATPQAPTPMQAPVTEVVLF